MYSMGIFWVLNFVFKMKFIMKWWGCYLLYFNLFGRFREEGRKRRERDRGGGERSVWGRGFLMVIRENNWLVELLNFLRYRSED